jgi:hypothetical protein
MVEDGLAEVWRGNKQCEAEAIAEAEMPVVGGADAASLCVVIFAFILFLRLIFHLFLETFFSILFQKPVKQKHQIIS